MFKLITMRSLRMVAVTLLVCLLGGIAVAQSTVDGAIGGKVTDATGAILPNATVTITNLGTNAVKTASTDSAGSFRVPFLPPGRYSVEITNSGFSPFKATSVVVEVGRVTELNAAMGVAASSETVEVSGEAPVVNTLQQDFSTNINQTSINELPINGRRWSNFALLTPGATPDGDFGLISFRGISGLLNNNTVDGGDNNNAFYAEERGRTRIGYVISQASIQEFQVNASNFSAEYGRSAGGVVNAVTKSGTNQFHGQVFWYYRNNELGATNAFTKLNGVVFKPEDIRHQFGGNLGGPIIQDKLFFFYNYDQQKRNFPGLATPTNAGITADLSASDMTTLTGRGLTAAQAQAGLDFIRSQTGLVPRTGDQTLHFPKIDWKIKEGYNLALSYNRLRWLSPGGIQTQPNVARGTTAWGNDFVKTDSFIAKLSSTLSPRVGNESRFQYGRDLLGGSPQEPLATEPISSLGAPVGVSIASGQFRMGSPDYVPRPANPDETRIQGANTTSIAAGRHFIKFGFDVNYVEDYVDSLSNKFGTYNYNNRLDFITDYIQPSQKRYTTFNQGLGTGQVKFDTKDINMFIQDDWKVLPYLTVNLGLRYEYIIMPDPQIPNPNLLQTGVIPNDPNNIGPRVGAAWDVLKNGKLSVRGGYGIYYGRYVNSTLSSVITNTGITTGAGQYSISIPSSAAGSPTYGSVVATGNAPGGPSVAFFGAHTDVPKIDQWDAIVEYEVMKNTVLSASYIGSRGHNLPVFVDSNLPTGRGTVTYHFNNGPLQGSDFTREYFRGARPNTSFGSMLNIEHIVETKYDALVLQANRRMSRGLQFQANYTLANAEDTGQTSQTFVPNSTNVLDPSNLALEEARSNFNIRHRAVISAVWQPSYFQNGSEVVRGIVSNWTIAPIVAMSAGKPHNARTSGNLPSSFGATSSGPVGSNGIFRVPSLARNAFEYPATYNIDLRIARSIPLGEKYGKLELVAEAFNLFNHLNVTSQDELMYTLTSTGSTFNAATATGTVNLNYNPLFKNATAAGNTVYRERQIQWAIRYSF